jgi:serine/threonine protein kinase
LPYYAAWWEAGGTVLVVQTRWASGGCVRTDHGPMPLAKLVLFGATLASVLERMHDRGIVHLDVKPENVLIDEPDGDDGAPQFLLADFGLARRVDKHGAGVVRSGDDDSVLPDPRSFEGDARYLCPEALDAGTRGNFTRMSISPPSGSRSRVQDDDNDSDDGVVDDDNNDDDDGRVRPGRERSVGLGLALGLDDVVEEDENVRKFSLLLGFKRRAPETVRPARRRQRFRPSHNSHTAGSDDDDEDEDTVIPQGSGSGSASVSGEDDVQKRLAIADGLTTDSYSAAASNGNDLQQKTRRRSGQLGPIFDDLSDSEDDDGDGHANAIAKINNDNGDVDDDDDDEDEGFSPVVPPQKKYPEPDEPGIGSPVFKEPALPLRLHRQHAPRQTPVPLRNLRASDVFSLGASLFELATGVPLEKSGHSWHWLRNNSEQVMTQVEKATGSRPLARIVKLCLARDPLARPSAASVTAMFAEIAPEQSVLDKARAEVAALKANNQQLRSALSQLMASERNIVVSGGGTAKPKSRIGNAAAAVGSKAGSKAGSKIGSKVAVKHLVAKDSTIDQYVTPANIRTCTKGSAPAEAAAASSTSGKPEAALRADSIGDLVPGQSKRKQIGRNTTK